MADPIRPGFNPNPQANPRPSGGGGAAQRAFFAAAMGQTAAPVAQAAPQAVAQTTVSRAAPASPQRIPTSLPADPPTRILRPGSLLDIKV